MKEKDNYILIFSQYAFILNQVIFEICIIVGLYIYMTKIYPFSLTTKNNNKLLIRKYTKSIIILYSLFAILLDWFIWNNATQTIFFTGILIVYCNYNLNNIDVISTFMDMTGSSYKQITDKEMLESSIPKCDTVPAKQPAISEINLPYDLEKIQPYGIKPFDTKDAKTSNKEIHEVYKSDHPYVSITDSAYATAMLNDLYATPQYKNIQDIEYFQDNTN